MLENKTPKQPLTQEQMIAEMYEFTRKTKKYMQWQLYITIALVVIPLMVAIFAIPYAINSFQSTYSLQGLLPQ